MQLLAIVFHSTPSIKYSVNTIYMYIDIRLAVYSIYSHTQHRTTYVAWHLKTSVISKFIQWVNYNLTAEKTIYILSLFNGPPALFDSENTVRREYQRIISLEAYSGGPRQCLRTLRFTSRPANASTWLSITACTTTRWQSVDTIIIWLAFGITDLGYILCLRTDKFI